MTGHYEFAPGAFDGNIGKKVPLRIEGTDETYETTIRDVQVTGDGVAMSFDIPAAVFARLDDEHHFSIANSIVRTAPEDDTREGK